MENIKVLDVTVYNIEDKVEENLVKKTQATEYVYSIVSKSVNNDNVRYFKAKRDTTEVVNLINELIIDKIKGNESEVAAALENEDNASFKNIAERIALRLLEQEKIAQDKVVKMGIKIRKGSLIQAALQLKESEFAYVLAKVEHVAILDKNNWEKHSGLPLEKEILKTCLINYDNEGNINEIRIFDSNKVISDYWSTGLLELEPYTTDENNTKKSFVEIDKFLVKNIKSKSPADYTNLFNSLVGYYNQNTRFDYSDLVEKVFINYIPYDKEKINMNEYENKLNILPNGKFDRQFDVKPESIRKKKKKTYNIGAEIELTIKDNISNLSDVIKVEENDGTGEKFLKIKINDNIYREFNFE